MHDSQANRPGKAVYHIAGNMHKSIVYYSLFKSQKDFFLDLFIVADEVNQQNQRYSQHLTLIQRERLSRKDFMESMNALVISRVIKWIRMHRGEVSTHATPHGKENISGI